MAVLKTGQEFASGDQVTSQKLMDIADLATFDDAADGSTIIVDSERYGNAVGDGKLKVKAGGITSNELADNSVGTSELQDDAVTSAEIANNAVAFANMQDIDSYKVIGRTSANNGDPEEVSILDEDDMTSDSNTALATQQSIKAYIQSYVSEQITALDKIVASARVTITSQVLTTNKSDGMSIGRNSGGNYTCTFTTPQPNADYIVLLTRTHTSPGEGAIVVSEQSTTSFKIFSSNDDAATQDPNGFNVMVLNY